MTDHFMIHIWPTFRPVRLSGAKEPNEPTYMVKSLLLSISPTRLGFNRTPLLVLTHACASEATDPDLGSDSLVASHHERENAQARHPHPLCFVLYFRAQRRHGSLPLYSSLQSSWFGGSMYCTTFRPCPVESGLDRCLLLNALNVLFKLVPSRAIVTDQRTSASEALVSTPMLRFLLLACKQASCTQY